jgi:hypothetical protein
VTRAARVTRRDAEAKSRCKRRRGKTMIMEEKDEWKDVGE